MICISITHGTTPLLCLQSAWDPYDFDSSTCQDLSAYPVSMRHTLLYLLLGSALAVSGVGLLWSRHSSDLWKDGHTIFPDQDSTTVHPGGPFYVDFNGPVPAGTSFSFVDSKGVPIQFRTRFGEEGQSVYIEPQVPLKWQEHHELCVDPPRRNFLHRILAERRLCSTFHTMERQKGAGNLEAPILVIQGADRPFSRFYPAILQAEGLNAYSTVPIEDLTDSMISNRSVILYDSAGLPKGDQKELISWVQNGGLLILMRPSPELRRLFGLSEPSQGAFQSASVTTDMESPITSGFPQVPFHIPGPIDRIPDVSGTPPVVETLLRVATGKTSLRVEAGHRAHAAEMIPVGKGHIVSFAFDFSQSIVFKRQGNPVLVDEERDGSAPVRPNDLFPPDRIQVDSALIPSADELQRLLVNIIAQKAPTPVPRFWYLPDKRRAVLVMAADDHRTDDGTLDHFATMDAMSPPDCDLEGWECLRASSYLSPGTIFSREDATFFSRKGFEIGVHVDTACEVPRTRPKLNSLIRSQIQDFRAEYPDLPEQQTHRIHCIIWKGWIDVPQAQREVGIRLDLNYYHWSPEWLKGRQIFMTGSGFPMPFARRDGSILDAYQSATHLVNENEVPHEEGILSALDRALGPEQYFGAFVTHYDFTKDYARRLIELGRERGVAMITSQQLLSWLDGRNASAFEALEWNGTKLKFMTQLDDAANNAYAALPFRFRDMTLSKVICGEPLKVTTDVIKGIPWAFFPATQGACTATYETSTT